MDSSAGGEGANEMALVTFDGARRSLPASVVGRSKLLQDLLQHADSSSELSVPMYESAVSCWMDHLQKKASSDKENVSVSDVESMKQLLQVRYHFLYISFNLYRDL